MTEPNNLQERRRREDWSEETEKSKVQKKKSLSLRLDSFAFLSPASGFHYPVWASAVTADGPTERRGCAECRVELSGRTLE